MEVVVCGCAIPNGDDPNPPLAGFIVMLVFGAGVPKDGAKDPPVAAGGEPKGLDVDPPKGAVGPDIPPPPKGPAGAPNGLELFRLVLFDPKPPNPDMENLSFFSGVLPSSW